MSMDVLLQRQPNGSLSRPRSSDQILLSEPLRSQSIGELSEEIRKLKNNGIGLVSVRRQQVLRLGRDRLQHMLCLSGIQVGAVGYAGGFTGTLGPGYEQAVADTRRAIELAANLNARAVVVLPGARGLHTWNHAGATIRNGLERCLDDALRFRVDIQIPLNSVIGRRNDVFELPHLSPLDWISTFDSHRIKAMMVLRGRAPWFKLPDCWKRCFLNGGLLRLSRRCRELEGTQQVISHIIRELSQTSVPRRTATGTKTPGLKT